MTVWPEDDFAVALREEEGRIEELREEIDRGNIAYSNVKASWVKSAHAVQEADRLCRRPVVEGHVLRMEPAE